MPSWCIRMDNSDIEEIREFWDRVADDWEIQVGDEGDSNRQLNSEPVLWDLAGDVRRTPVSKLRIWWSRESQRTDTISLTTHESCGTVASVPIQ